MTVYFGPWPFTQAKTSLSAVHFDAIDRQLWLKTVYFHPFGPSTLDLVPPFPKKTIFFVNHGICAHISSIYIQYNKIKALEMIDFSDMKWLFDNLS